MKTPDPATSLGALGHEARYAALRLLVSAGSGGLSAGELARRLDVAPSNLSFHVAALSNVGLVTSERRGQSIIYRSQTDAIAELLVALTRDLASDG